MTPFRISLLVLAAIVAVIVYRSGSSADSALAYVADWDQAVEQSRTTGKPLLVNFGGPW